MANSTNEVIKVAAVPIPDASATASAPGRAVRGILRSETQSHTKPGQQDKERARPDTDGSVLARAAEDTDV